MYVYAPLRGVAQLEAKPRSAIGVLSNSNKRLLYCLFTLQRERKRLSLNENISKRWYKQLYKSVEIIQIFQGKAEFCGSKSWGSWTSSWNGRFSTVSLSLKRLSEINFSVLVCTFTAFSPQFLHSLSHTTTPPLRPSLSSFICLLFMI